jgi:hypothetical protein
MPKKRLDESTLKGLADLISYGGRVPGYIGNEPLTVAENRKFFERAGVEAVFGSVFSELNTFDSLKKFNSEESGKLLPLSLEQVLLRFADPREYGGDRKSTEAVVFRLNRLLWPEGLKVVLEGATPRLREIDSIAAAPSAPQSHLHPPDLRPLVADQKLLEILVSRWEEAQKCMGMGAYRSAVIMMGSI